MISYFETSAVNYMTDRFSIGDAIATKAFQEVRGRKWVISPVAIWEILLTSNDVRKEELIYFSQHLFHEELMPSPEEMVIKYIEQGCPLVEQQRPLISESSLAETWRDLCKTPQKTFIYDKEDLKKKNKIIVDANKTLHVITKSRDLITDLKDPTIGFDISLEGMVDNLSWVKEGEHVSAEGRKIYKLSIYFMLIMLCSEVGVDPDTTRRFWNKVGINGTAERVCYLMKHHETLVHRGPIVQMAYMTLAQSKGKYSRGMFWDSLHSFYLTYVDFLFSEDEHFYDLKTSLSDHPNALKIQKLSEAEWSFQDRENHVKDSPIHT